MKHKLIFLIFLIFCISCGKAGDSSKKGAAADGEGNYAIFSYLNDYYEAFKLYENGNFEYFATTAVNSGGVVTITGWYKAEGTYTMDGSTLSLNGTVTGKNTNLVNCDDPFVAPLPYTETVDSITTMGKTYTQESVSGLSRPSVSAFPDDC